ncbi:MAG: pirin family protein [Alphaproteobacteria bacterium]|nr:pirin family protein [Alphaproteobacteria bacterium]
MNTKNITRVNRGAGAHWVGDGFPVNTMFSYDTQGPEISPFLLLDYAGPANFEPADKPRGVEKHPHRGFETVTIVYQGEVEHSDSAGNSGKVGPGDVQWMTAARGIVHEEMHGRAFTQKGGTLEMIQLWVNLPAKDKMSDPRYQEILSDSIPVVDLPGGGGILRLIAGEYNGIQGAARTVTPVNLWDMRLKSGHKMDLSMPEGHNTSLLVMSGKVVVNGAENLGAKELALFSREGETISLEIQADSVVLLMGGEPIEEPIAGRGPFVMNTNEEIRTAMNDYAYGRF